VAKKIQFQKNLPHHPQNTEERGTLMKNALLVSLFMAFCVWSAAAQTGPLHLRYEWSPDTSGPWMALPPEMLKVHEDGSATVAPSGSKGFFRLLIREGTAGGGG
jgi:hypothetical protein